MVEAVLFDYGGVLSAAGKKGALEERIARHLNINVADLDIRDLRHQIRRGQINSQAFFEELNRRYPSDDPVTEKYFADKEYESTRQAKEIYELSKVLRANYIKTGILSNVFQPTAEVLREIGAYDGFDPVILSYEVKVAKPESEVYELALARLAVEPKAVVYVDDQEECLQPAAELGIKIIKADTPSQIIHDMSRILLEENGIKL